ncbi:MAG TPA: type II toxin-antitoxin system VapC family toxin [Bryobacteraceae bacterium]
MESGRQLLTYLDTHAALWLCAGEVRFSPRVLKHLENAELRISPFVLLEMQFLQEIGRLNVGPDQWLDILKRDFEVRICPISVQRVVTEAFKLSWTRDPFDRIIVAQTIAGEGKLITKDDRIHKNFDGALW